MLSMDEATPPVTTDYMYKVYRQHMLYLLGWLNICGNSGLSCEDYLHETYLLEKRYNGWERWEGIGKASSWFLHSMRLFRSHIIPVPRAVNNDHWKSWKYPDHLDDWSWIKDSTDYQREYDIHIWTQELSSRMQTYIDSTRTNVRDKYKRVWDCMIDTETGIQYNELGLRLTSQVTQIKDHLVERAKRIDKNETLIYG